MLCRPGPRWTGKSTGYEESAKGRGPHSSVKGVQNGDALGTEVNLRPAIITPAGQSAQDPVAHPLCTSVPRQYSRRMQLCLRVCVRGPDLRQVAHGAFLERCL